MTSPARSPRPNIQKVHHAGDEGSPSAPQDEASGRQQGGGGRAPGLVLHQGEGKHRWSRAVMVTLGRAGGGEVVPAQRASGTPPRRALPPQSPEGPPGEAGRPSLPWGHTCPPAVPTETGKVYFSRRERVP